MRVPAEKDEELYYEHFNEADRKKIVTRQHRVADLAKRRGLREIPQICI